jgi:hypothetical protein
MSNCNFPALPSFKPPLPPIPIPVPPALPGPPTFTLPALDVDLPPLPALPNFKPPLPPIPIPVPPALPGPPVLPNLPDCPLD